MTKNVLSTISNEQQQQQQLLLSVPFYVYEELIWDDATFGGVPINLSLSGQHPLLKKYELKHTSDYLFMRASLNHPMRTLDISKAKLFVVPILTNTYAMTFADSECCGREQYKLCWERKTNNNGIETTTKLCQEELMDYASKVLSQSTAFRNSGGSNHIAVASHWFFASHLYAKKYFWNSYQLSSFFPVLTKMNLIQFENYNLGKTPNKQANNQDTELIGYSDYYVGHGCPNNENMTRNDDFVFVGFLDKKNLKQRKAVCKSMNSLKDTGTLALPSGSVLIASRKPRMTTCGVGTQCPLLAQAKFGFHTNGDTPGSNRLMDTILSGTVPVFTSKEQYGVLPPWIDWDQLSYYANPFDPRSFIRQIDSLLSISETKYKRVLGNLLSNQDLFDWTTMIPFDTYLHMLQYKLYPETVDTTVKSTYSALKLPYHTYDHNE